MAEDFNKKYSYHEMSNKVEQADRSQFRRRAHEPTGEVETLRGRSDIGRMGDRVVGEKSSRPTELQEKMNRKRKKHGGHGVAKQKESVVAAAGGVHERMSYLEDIILRKRGEIRAVAESTSLTELARSVLNSNEFLYVD